MPENYRPGLDVVRLAALLPVLCYHYCIEAARLGFAVPAALIGRGMADWVELGLAWFFLLSGAALCGETFTTDDLAGGTPEENAALMRGVLSGKIGGAKRTASLLNAAAAIYVAGKAESLAEAVKVARMSVDSGAALAKLERMVSFS